MRVYICPEHPEKTYTSWRKFRGHWSTQHRGEECPPREEFLREMEREEVLGKKKEHKEELKEGATQREEVAGAIAAGEFILPEDPIPRLAKILEVHGVPGDLTTQILGVFQLHPGYRENPVNLHYLLTAKLPRKLHSSIPMMISAFTTQEGGYPEGIPMMGGQSGMGMGPMPPFMYGGGMSPYYSPTVEYQPYFRPPISGREEGREGERRERVKEANPVQDAVALLGTLMDLQGKLSPGEKEGGPSVQEIFEGFRATIEEVTKDSKDQQDKLITQMGGIQEANKATLEGIQGQLHQAEKDRLQDKIDTLVEAKDEERSEGLGTLLKEAGEGIGSQLEGVRGTLEKGMDKATSLVEKAVAVEGVAVPPTGEGAAKTPQGRTPGAAKDLLEAEAKIEELATKLAGGKK